MIDISKGRYWEEGIELVSGCTPCSPGCDRCWSAAMTHRWNFHWTNFKNNFPGQKPTGVRFNGKITVRPARLKRFNTRKPKVFAIWNDLFHEDVPDVFIRDVYEKASINQRNTYLFLTKRQNRLLDTSQSLRRYIFHDKWQRKIQYPQDHIWHGLTVCNQQEADEKIPIFLRVPGKKFLSIEPCLSEINFRWTPYHYQATGETYRQYLERKSSVNEYESLKQIDAVILGGETGPGARPMNPDWVRSVRDQCAAAGVPFFFKSWGKHLPGLNECFGDEVVSPYSSLAIDVKRLIDGRTHDDLPWGEK